MNPSWDLCNRAPANGKPVVMDDTIYFLPCQSEEEADFVMSLWSSRSPTWHLSGP